MRQTGMKAITLRKLPPELASIVHRRAREKRLSINRAVISLMEETLLGSGGKLEALYHDLDHLAGCWTAEEAAAFDRSLAEQRKVDPELWK
jgi:hypothetical protein